MFKWNASFRRACQLHARPTQAFINSARPRHFTNDASTMSSPPPPPSAQVPKKRSFFRTFARVMGLGSVAVGGLATGSILYLEYENRFGDSHLHATPQIQAGSVLQSNLLPSPVAVAEGPTASKNDETHEAEAQQEESATILEVDDSSDGTVVVSSNDHEEEEGAPPSAKEAEESDNGEASNQQGAASTTGEDEDTPESSSSTPLEKEVVLVVLDSVEANDGRSQEAAKDDASVEVETRTEAVEAASVVDTDADDVADEDPDQNDVKVMSKEEHGPSDDVSEVEGTDDPIVNAEPDHAASRSEEQPSKITISEFIELQREFDVKLKTALEQKDEELRDQLEKMKQALIRRTAEQLANDRWKMKTELEEEAEARLAEHLESWKRHFIAQESEVASKLTHESQWRQERLRRMEEELHKLMRTIDEKSEVDRKSSQFQIICLAILAIDEAINGSRSFASEVEEIRSAASSYPEVLQALDKIPENVPRTGVETLLSLRERFENVKRVGRREGMVPKNGSLIWEGVATVVSVMAPPQQGLVDGDDPDSIFARAEYYLNRGCLEKAIEELDRLQGRPKKVAEGWLKAARERVLVEGSIASVRSVILTHVKE